MWENLLVGVIVGVVVLLGLRALWRVTHVKEGSGDGCGCSSAGSCSLAKKCPTKAPPPPATPTKAGG